MTTTTPPRPTITDDMVREAAKKLLSDYKCTENADDIMRYYKHWVDGYELAKTLDSYCGWSVDAATVEMLEELPSRVNRILEKSQKEWAAAYNIQPKLKAGATIERGTIAGVSEHSAASYKVKENGCTKDGRFVILPFEQAEAEA